MMRPFEIGDITFDEEPEVTRLIPKPKKKAKQRGWRSYRNTWLKNKEVWGMYVYNGVNEEGYISLIRIN